MCPAPQLPVLAGLGASLVVNALWDQHHSRARSGSTPNPCSDPLLLPHVFYVFFFFFFPKISFSIHFHDVVPRDQAKPATHLPVFVLVLGINHAAAFFFCFPPHLSPNFIKDAPTQVSFRALNPCMHFAGSIPCSCLSSKANALLPEELFVTQAMPGRA